MAKFSYTVTFLYRGDQKTRNVMASNPSEASGQVMEEYQGARIISVH